MAKNKNFFLFMVQIFTVNFIAAQVLEDQRIQSHAPCRLDIDCRPNAFCFGNDDTTRGNCKCKEGFELYRNLTDYKCLGAVRLGDACEEHFQCKVLAGPMAICNTSNICDCNEFAHAFSDGLCYRSVKLTEPCLSDHNCKLADGTFGFCTDGHCSCSLRHRPSPDLTNCWVFRRMGQACNLTSDCLFVPNAVCDGICRCGVRFSLARDGQSCLRAATHFGEPCIEDDQCSKFLQLSICVQGNCSCPAGCHVSGTRCIPTSRAGERCREDISCVFDRRLEGNVQCSGGVCTCSHGPSDDFFGCRLEPADGAGVSVKPEFVGLVTTGFALFYSFLRFQTG